MRGLRAALLLTAGLGGCRQVLGLDEREVGATDLTADNYVDAHARAFCGDAEPCCAKYSFGFQSGSCERELAGYLQAQVAEARSAGLAFDPAAALECVRASSEISRACEPAQAQYAARDDACDRVYRGTKAPGEPCQVDAECAFGPGDGVFCSENNGPPSRCHVDHSGVEGDPCGGDDPFIRSDCQRNDGVWCDRELKRCVPLLGDGQPCTGEYACGKESFCKLGTCAPKGGLGAVCVSDYDSCNRADCTVGPCLKALYCDPTSKTCVPGRPLGAECDESLECESDFCNDDRCVPENTLAGFNFCGAPRR